MGKAREHESTEEEQPPMNNVLVIISGQLGRGMAETSPVVAWSAKG